MYELISSILLLQSTLKLYEVTSSISFQEEVLATFAVVVILQPSPEAVPWSTLTYLVETYS